MNKSLFLTIAFAFLCSKVGALEIAPSIAGKFNIDRVELYIECYGTGLPNIVVNTGFGGAGSDSSWSKVVTEVSKTNRICLYDRANLGKSDKSLDTYDVGVMAKQLQKLLVAAEVKPPYLMIGHSYGSYPIKIFRDLYPHQVDAILLVDPSLYGMFYGNIAKWKPESEQYDKTNLERMNAELDGWNNPALNPEKIDLKSSAKLIKESTDFEDTPFVLLWAANAIWQGGEAPADWHPNVWERMKTLYACDLARMQSLSSQTKIVFAKTPEHFIHVYEPEAVLNEIIYLRNKIASK